MSSESDGQMQEISFNRMEGEETSLLSLVTAVVQAQEKLHLYIKKQRVQANNASLDDTLLPESIRILDAVRGMRSKVDGSHFSLDHVCASPEKLSELKSLMLMHIPSSVDKQVQEKFYQLISNFFKESRKKVLFALLVTCPWYWSTHTDRGQQAKHNKIFVVFANDDRDFFCPCPVDQKIRNNVIDEGWFYATEVSLFVQYLAKGKSRCVETLFPADGAVLYEAPEWTALSQLVCKKKLLRLQGFIEQCRGQAVGTLAKKNKSGRMKLVDTATLYQFCESFRLLNHVEDVAAGRTLCLDMIKTSEVSSHSQRALQGLTQAYTGENVTKVDLLAELLSWREDIDVKVRGMQFTSHSEITESLGEWLAHIRTHGGQVVLSKSNLLCCDDRGKVESLMKKIGGGIESFHAEQILMIARAGSFLYNLHTESSDVDYIVVYAEKTENVISAIKGVAEIKESRGPHKQIEYGAYEARMFCEMLWKASIVILELVFCDDLEYMSAAWKELISLRDSFVTENAILQYIGILRNNLKDIRMCKYKDNPKRESKIFYQIFHKLDSLGYLVRGECPAVKCSGELRDFIMKIRRGPLSDEFSREKLQSVAEQQLDKLQVQLAGRCHRLREHADMNSLTQWLLRVRGWHATS